MRPTRRITTKISGGLKGCHRRAPLSQILQTPPGVHRGVYPSMHWGRDPSGQTPPGQTPPLGRHPSLPSACWVTPPPTATAADGTHPTGMHSCFHEVSCSICVPILEILDPTLNCTNRPDDSAER